LLAHDDVLKQVWAVAARFVLARRRVVQDIRVAVQDIRVAVKAPEYARPSIFTTALCRQAANLSRLVVSRS
jgi:hypothetical protein